MFVNLMKNDQILQQKCLFSRKSFIWSDENRQSKIVEILNNLPLHDKPSSRYACSNGTNKELRIGCLDAKYNPELRTGKKWNVLDFYWLDKSIDQKVPMRSWNLTLKIITGMWTLYLIKYIWGHIVPLNLQRDIKITYNQ